MTAALRVINLGVRFFLELAALAAIAFWGATIRAPILVRTIVAIVSPLGVAMIWALFISPKARFSSGRVGQAGLGLLVFLAAAAALFARGHQGLAAAFAVIAAISSALLYALP